MSERRTPQCDRDRLQLLFALRGACHGILAALEERNLERAEAILRDCLELIEVSR